MKRIIIITLVILSVAALLCACGAKANVKTTVDAKYDDGYAQSYAAGTSTDESGNKVYEFTQDKYQEYIDNHKNVLAKDVQDIFIASHGSDYGEFAYINTEKQAVMIGIHEDEYDADSAEEEAAAAAEYGFNYFQNLENPVSTIKVIYCNANDQSQEFGSFTFTAE